MKKMKNIKNLILIVMLAASIPLQAAGLKKVAQSGMQWLSIPVGARAAALGGAYTAVANDASSIFWNPAGVALSNGGNLFIAQTNWIADINVNAASVSYDAGGLGYFSASFAGVDWGVFHGTRRSETSAGFVETGEFSPTNWAAGMGYARRVTDRFAIGGHLRYLHENLGSTLEGTMDAGTEYTAKTSLMAFDFGTIYYTGFKDLRLAMSLQNFSEEKKYREAHFPLPLTFKFGIAMDMTSFWTSESPHSVLLSVDAIHPRDYTERMNFGLEYGFKNMFFLRGGYKTNYDEEDFTVGGGLNYEIGGFALGIDYSYLQFQHFDAVQMFTVNFHF
ncbi:MAG: PorV/PorQ family protein [Candidatus Marinimicrobia bacterium]|nr:PorV/PorQ family protein [Candidatus Neomarinimicrobiota bacterium]MCF7830218.1 PorV/PorQ family protein [Candidatus Neomarinimicrobiota bacterium]MCF7880835.1 PorV/PorQ family protein [Candidatus Neomarinimicrobiota bacterium]